MQIEVVMPKMGESIQEGKILRWMKKPGDRIEKDESILEISTDKVDSEIPSPSAGILTKIVVPEGETVEVGTIVAYIETDVSAAKVESALPAAASGRGRTADEELSVEKEGRIARLGAADSGGRPRNGERFYSPLVRTIARREGIAVEELDRISGTGIGGRVTKADILGYLERRVSGPTAVQQPAPVRRVDSAELQKKYPAPQHEIVPMDNVQVKMAEHMVRSVHTSPHVEAISECDVSRIAEFRAKNAERFEKQEGFKLTFTPFFVHAAIRALKEYPIVNSSIEGDKIILKKFVNFGIAVAAPTGLIVPVIKNAEEKSFLGLARAINDLALRARNRKLSPDEIQGGTFTLTNFGVFGNIIGTPIINQPQVAILGVGAVKKRPVVVTDSEGNDSIAIRSIVFLTLAFDHRIIDGAIGGQFLGRIVSNLEQYDLSRVF